jgi:hypothetical protein
LYLLEEAEMTTETPETKYRRRHCHEIIQREYESDKDTKQGFTGTKKISLEP